MDRKRRRTGGDANADTNTQCYTDGDTNAYIDSDTNAYADSYTRRDTAACSDPKSSSYAAAQADYSFPPIILKCP